MTTALLHELDACAEEGLLRRLGCAFARFIASLADTPPCVLLTCVLLSELESRGDTCLLIDDLADDPCAKLHLDRERTARLHDAAGGFPGSKAAWLEALSSCPQVYTPGKPDRNQPLVLEHDRLYLRRFWCDERSIARLVARRAAHLREVEPARVKDLLGKLFPSDAAGAAPDWQKIACAVAARSDVSIITGGPGTGKTYTVARLLALLYALAPDPEGLRVALAAPSGKAATRLKQSIDKALSDLAHDAGGAIDFDGLMSRLPGARTLHSLLGANPETRSVRHHAGNPLEVDVLVVDEASMVHLEMMADLLEALPAHAMLVLLGDKDQLSSVEAGAVLGDLCEGAERGNYDARTAAYVKAACGEDLPAEMRADGLPLSQRTIMLRQSRRFSGPIGQLALAVNADDIGTAQRCLREEDGLQLKWHEQARQADLLELAVRGRPGADGGYASYLRLAAKRPDRDEAAHEAWIKSVLDAFDRFRILTAVRRGDWGVEGVNQAVEQQLVKEKLIVRNGEWYVGRPVMATRNDHALGIYNGDVGIALPDIRGEGRLRVYFVNGDRITGVLPTRLPGVETAYAMTVHKAQGSEFAHTVLALPDNPGEIVVRELVYTGITRAREAFTLLTPEAEVFGQGVRKRTARASGLRRYLEEEQADGSLQAGA